MELLAGELRRILDLVPSDYAVHIEGRSIGTVDLHERVHRALERTEASKESPIAGRPFWAPRKTTGIVNLVPSELKGALADDNEPEGEGSSPESTAGSR